MLLSCTVTRYYEPEGCPYHGGRYFYWSCSNKIDRNSVTFIPKSHIGISSKYNFEIREAQRLQVAYCLRSFRQLQQYNMVLTNHLNLPQWKNFVRNQCSNKIKNFWFEIPYPNTTKISIKFASFFKVFCCVSLVHRAFGLLHFLILNFLEWMTSH